MATYKRGTLEERFFDKVTKQDGCWKWNATKHRLGYGMIRQRGESAKLLAHRASWIIHFGDIPQGMHVMHKCDNPECTNPDHLSLGSIHDNMRDKIKKDRGNDIIKGKNRILVKQLYEAGVSQRNLSKILNVARNTIRNAIRKA